MYLDEIKPLINAATPPLRIVGCTEEEVAALEAQLHMAFPLAFREFLLWIGKDGGPILIGEDSFYKDILNIQEWAVELLADNHFPHQLPEDAFVISMHQGYDMFFLRLSEGDDPPLYYYTETREQQDFNMHYKRYSEYLRIYVQRAVDHWNQNPDWYRRIGRM